MDGLKSRGQVVVIGAIRPNSIDWTLRSFVCLNRELDIVVQDETGR